MVCWLVDELLSERAYETGYPSIGDVARELGHQVYKLYPKLRRGSMEETDWTAFELMWQLENKEISLLQFKAQCKDLGWTEDEIEECLDGYGEDEELE